ncbi:MAG: hypothetical protein KDD62_06935, partial [Bdellovibrionales bacterium]|nr:hypothetical protein [Bdellovibrionales bacterium]
CFTLLTQAGGTIFDPDLRERIYNMWVSSIKDQFGIDHYSRWKAPEDRTSYHQEIIERIKVLSMALGGYERVVLLNKLAVTLEAQDEICDEIENALLEPSKIDLEQGDKIVQIGDTIIDIARYSSRFRKGLVAFLSSPLSNASVKSFANLLDSASSSWLSQAVLFPNQEHSIDLLTGEHSQSMLRHFYENFARSREELRCAFLREVIMPASDDSFYDALNAFDFAFERALPNKTEQDRYVQSMAKLYVRLLPPFVQPYVLAALVSASRKSTDSNQNLGEAIARVVDEIGGPAEQSILQKAQGNSKTPFEWRKAFAKQKTNAAPLLHWELNAHLRRILPPRIQERIQHKGVAIGGGKLYVASLIEMQSEDRSQIGTKVLSSLRPYALSRGKTGYEAVENDPIADAIREQVEAGSRFLKIEADSVRALEIAERVKELYCNTSVDVLGEHFKIDAYSIEDAGNQFFITDLVQGANVIKLPEGSVEQQKARIANLTNGLARLIFIPGYRNNDDHGGNVLRTTAGLTVIDQWGLLLPASTIEQQSVISHAFGKALANSTSGSQLQQTFVATLEKADDISEFDREIFANTKEGLMALSESLEGLKRNQILHAIRAAYEAAPHETRDAFRSGLSSTYLGRLILWRLHLGNPKVRITIS